MKATGIIRRIDDLGRIVIPKEIRRSQRIHYGDPLEIFTEKDGTIILKQYSPDDLIDIAGGIARTLYKLSAIPVLICSHDKMLGIVGGKYNAKELQNTNITEEYRKRLEDIRDRGPYSVKMDTVEPLTNNDSIKAFLSAPFVNRSRGILGSFSFLYRDAVPEISKEIYTRFMMAVACVEDLYDGAP